MFADLKKNVSDIKDDSQIEGYLKKVLKGEAFDGSGLIYGMDMPYIRFQIQES